MPLTKTSGVTLTALKSISAGSTNVCAVSYESQVWIDDQPCRAYFAKLTPLQRARLDPFFRMQAIAGIMWAMMFWGARHRR